MYKLRKILRDDMVMMSIAIIGCSFLLSLSSTFNAGYGFINGFWWIMLSASFTTAVLSELHARKEAGRVRVGAHYDVQFLRICYFLLVAMFVVQNVNWMMIALAFQQGSLFGIIFDPRRNHYAGDPIFYNGNHALYDRGIKAILKRIKWKEVSIFVIEIIIQVVTVYLLLKWYDGI